jgi:hypothetical protein
MKVIEILIYGLGLLEFPYNESLKDCHANAKAIYEQNELKHFSSINPPEIWAEGDYWLAEDGKYYRLAGHRCIDKETGKEIGRNRLY